MLRTVRAVRTLGVGAAAACAAIGLAAGPVAASGTASDGGAGGAPFPFRVRAVAPASTPNCGVVTGATATTVYHVDASTGDGSKDATSAIQSQIDQATANGGGVVMIPAGVFSLSGHLVLKSGVKLSGAGIARTVLRAAKGFLDATGPEGGYPVISTDQAVNVTVDNLTADQSGGTLDESPLAGRLASSLIDVRDGGNVIVDSVATVNPAGYSIGVTGTSHFCVRDSSVRVTSSGHYDQLDGIHVLAGSDGYIVGNDVDNRVGGATDGDDGIALQTILSPVHDILVTGNTVRGGARGDGLQLAVGAGDLYSVSVADNEFYGSPEGIRTGWYGAVSGAVHDVSLTDNRIHDLLPGIAFPDGGQAVWIFASPNSASDVPFNVTVTGNTTCNAGVPAVIVAVAPGDTTSGNATC